MTIKKAVLAGTTVLALAWSAGAEMRPSLSLSGVSGLIDMPSGEQQSDGMLTATKSQFGPIGRTTLTFQITPRLSGSFRYTSGANWNDVVPGPFEKYFDRSFDLGYQLAYEGRFMPAISVGLQDVIGTGLLAGEYIAATKTFGDKVKVTAGLGWGRYGSSGSIGAPFGSRPAVDFGEGGKLRLGQWFKGDVAPFAGVEWQVKPRLRLKAEYSSDAYAEEAGRRKTFDRKSPFNFGVEYATRNGVQLGVYSLYGSEVGVSVSFAIDPKKSPRGGSLGPGPLPVGPRPAAQNWPAEWVSDKGSISRMRGDAQRILSNDGIEVEALSVTRTTAQLRIRNTRLNNAPQAIGRSARALAAVLPPSVEQFEIVPMVQGVAASKVVIQRRDLEGLEFAAGQDALMLDRTQVLPVFGERPDAGDFADGIYPRFKWNVAPFVATSLFDPNSPVRATLGVRATARYDVAPGLFFAGSIAKQIVGNAGDTSRVSNSVLQHVRSDANFYAAEGDPAIERLTVAWYTKPSEDLYGRVTAGYLEPMFGGVSAELLWKRVDRPYALGVEVNYVKQRNFDQLFGFKDYSVVTGHVSGYYAFKNGFHAQLDVGRYLAGDLGATFSLDREFANGIKVGAFATLTDVPFEDFGEGSFDKGIRIELPLAFLTGMQTQKAGKVTLRPLLRDGGARLSVSDRLYDQVRDYHSTDLDAAWGRFWR